MTVLNAMPERRLADRRAHDDAVLIDHRQSGRRVSPAIGEHAILEHARLRETKYGPGILAQASEEIAQLRTANAELVFRLAELLKTAEACDELYQHYKIRCSLAQPQASDGCEEKEPSEFALARAAIAKAEKS